MPERIELPAAAHPNRRARARLASALLLPALLLLPTLACAAPWRAEQPTAPAVETPAAPATEGAGEPSIATLPGDATTTPFATTVTITTTTPLPPATGAAGSTPFVELLAAAPAQLNPVLTTDRDALAVQRLFLPSLVELDATTGAVRPSLAESWLWASDNRTLTLTLRSDLSWSDGAPVTSRDAAFTLLALREPSVESPWAAQFAAMTQVTLPEPDTLVIEQQAPDCALLAQLRLPLLPSHLFAGDFSDLRTAAWNRTPSVGAGPYLVAAGAPGGELTLAPNASLAGGQALLNPLLVRAEPDAAARLQAVTSGLAQRAWDVPAGAPASQETDAVTLMALPSDGMSMLVMNLADPLAPQPGIAPDGVLQPQEPHPVLAELLVREAIARGVNWQQLVREAYGAAAAPLASWLPPALGWAHDPSVALPTYDMAAAAALLEQAGWVDAAGDGVRERADQLLQLTLITNDDNTQRAALAQAAGEALRLLGFDVRVELLPFAVAQDAVLGQRYDLAIVGWEALGPEPAYMDFWHTRGDEPGAGPNITSLQNPALNALLDEARTLPGCSEAGRAERYRTAQQVLAQELAALPLNAQLRFVATVPGWQGLPASIWAPYAGIESWQPPATPLP